MVLEKPLSRSVSSGGRKKEMPLASYDEFEQDKDPEFLFVSTLWLTGDCSGSQMMGILKGRIRYLIQEVSSGRKEKPPGL